MGVSLYDSKVAGVAEWPKADVRKAFFRRFESCLRLSSEPSLLTAQQTATDLSRLSRCVCWWSKRPPSQMRRRPDKFFDLGRLPLENGFADTERTLANCTLRGPVQ